MPLDLSSISFPDKLQPLFTPARYKVIHGGRGGAKSWGVARRLLLRGVEGNYRVLCVRQLQTSIAESVHKLLADQIDEMGLGDYYEVQKNAIYGPGGTEFHFEGVQNNVKKIKSYEGIDALWAEEADAMTKESWDILRPTIRKEGSEIYITFNPNLAKDYTYQHFVLKPPPGSIVIDMNYWDNPWFPDTLRQEMELCKATSMDDYLHIWCGKTKRILEGGVYARQLAKMLEDGRFCRVPYDKSLGVHTYWDLGFADFTSIWFVQFAGYEIRVIDYHEDCGLDMHDYAKFLQQEKPYTYEMANLPHDGKNRGIISKHSSEDILRGKGFDVRVHKRDSGTFGIDATRLLFHQVVMDEVKCEAGFERLTNYKYPIVDGGFGAVPIHDKNSHAASAFKTIALARRGKRAKGEQRLQGGSASSGRARNALSRLKERIPLGWMNQ